MTRQWVRVCNDLRVEDGAQLAYGDRFSLRGRAAVTGPARLPAGRDVLTAPSASAARSPSQ